MAGADLYAALATPGRIWPALMATRTNSQPPALYARGRGAGGSSSVNALGAVRGIPDDYDRWAELGCEGWAWDDVAGAFETVDAMVSNGPLPAGEWGPVGRALHGAAMAVGHPFVADHHVPAAGVSPFRLTLADGRRVSTNDAYLEPARGRPNLAIRGGALVDRVVVDRGKATGVVVDGEELDAGAVILAAGAIHSPAVLLRSGLDRPGVGANLADHVRANAVLSLREPGPPGRPPCTVIVRYSSGLGGDFDMQLLAFDHLGSEPERLAMGMVSVCLMEPRSTGSVRLASADPNVDPIVEFDFLFDDLDMERMVAGMRHLERVMDQAAFRSTCEFVGLDDSGTTFAVFEDEARVRAWLLASVQDYVHACGTCRMGRPDNPIAVVDPSCRYIGIDGLSVVDASVIPIIPRANTHLTTVMIAERIAAAM